MVLTRIGGGAHAPEPRCERACSEHKLVLVRGRALGAALALPVGLYTAYMLLQYLLGPEYLQRPGDNERVFPLLAALFAAGWIAALTGWRASGRARAHERPGGRSGRRARPATHVRSSTLYAVAGTVAPTWAARSASRLA